MAKLILLRHGESVWNSLNLFTGWVDIPLSAKGIGEALQAGDVLKDIPIDVIYTSAQIRAIETAVLAMSRSSLGKAPCVVSEKGMMGQRTRIFSGKAQEGTIPLYKHWRLNERYYGALQGLNKKETAEKYGEEQVHIWRRSFDVRPPKGESLKDTAMRTVPFFKGTIVKQLMAGKTVLVSAHGNSLRSIVMYLESLSPDDVLKLEIPTGVPIFYDCFLNGKGLSFARK